MNRAAANSIPIIHIKRRKKAIFKDRIIKYDLEKLLLWRSLSCNVSYNKLFKWTSPSELIADRRHRKSRQRQQISNADDARDKKRNEDKFTGICFLPVAPWNTHRNRPCNRLLTGRKWLKNLLVIELIFDTCAHSIGFTILINDCFFHHSFGFKKKKKTFVIPTIHKTLLLTTYKLTTKCTSPPINQPLFLSRIASLLPFSCCIDVR